MSTSMDFAITLINKVKEKEKQFTTEMSVLYYTLLAIRIGKHSSFAGDWNNKETGRRHRHETSHIKENK